MSVVTLFPRRPLKLQAIYQRPTIWRLLLMVAGALFIAFGTITSSLGLLDEYRLHTSGTPALRSHMDNGLCHERMIFDCELDAKYITRDGTELSHHVEYFTFFQKPDTDKRFLVRYDPASPEHISTSWGVGLLPNRTVTCLLGWVLIVGLVYGAISYVTGRRKLRTNLEIIGAQPNPTEVQFVKAHSAPNSTTATIAYTWRDNSGVEHKSSTEFAGTREPFWLDSTKSRMLALIGPQNQAYLLDSRLETVALTPQERAQLIEARDRSLSATAPGSSTVYA